MLRQTEDKNPIGKSLALSAVGVYALTIVGLMLWVKFTFTEPTAEGGILMDLGDTEAAAPGGNMAESIETADPAAVPEESNKEQLTQDFEEAPAVKNPEKEKPKPAVKPKKKPKVTPKKQKEEPKPEAPKREINQRALFRGGKNTGNSSNDGDAQGTGNQGNPNGDPNGTLHGTGSGGTGSSFDLSGRSLVGSLPRPAYDVKAEGRVIIEIRVGSQGTVQSASYRSKGSTTQNSGLVESALRAARKARFNVDENAPVQVGTITYIFRMQ